MQLYLLLNDSCNLKCPFCIRGASKGLCIDAEKLESVLSDNPFEGYSLLLTGGEPTLHPKFNDIVELCSRKFKHVSINTNGYLSNWVDNLKNPRIHVQISIDGDRNDHNRIRSGGTIDVYGHIEKTIEKLECSGISYNIATTVSKHNIDSVISLAKELKEFKKIRYWKVSPQLPFGCGNMHDVLDIKEWNAFVDKLISIANIRLAIKKYFDFDLLDSVIKENPNYENVSKTNCGNVKDKIYIYPDFTVYPCTCLTDFPLGNLLENSLDVILASEKAKVFSNYTLSEESVCRSCKYLKFCNGGCIGMSYHYFGKLGVGDYRCPRLKAMRPQDLK